MWTSLLIIVLYILCTLLLLEIRLCIVLCKHFFILWANNVTFQNHNFFFFFQLLLLYAYMPSLFLYYNMYINTSSVQIRDFLKKKFFHFLITLFLLWCFRLIHTLLYISFYNCNLMLLLLTRLLYLHLLGYNVCMCMV